MPEIPSPIDVQTWPQAIVMIVLIIAVLVVPAVLAFRTKLLTQQVQGVQETLTENNGGNSVKDRFDQLDKTLAAHLERSEKWERAIEGRVAALEQPRRRHRWPFNRS